MQVRAAGSFRRTVRCLLQMNMAAPARRRLYWIASITLVFMGVPLVSYGLNTHQSAASTQQARQSQPSQQNQQAQQNQGPDDPLKRQSKRKHGADDFAKRFLADVKLIITPEEEQ